jgi:hypothetical protein
LHHWHAGLTTYQNHFVNVTGAQASIFKRKLYGIHGARHQIFNQRFQLGTAQLYYQVLRAGCVGCDVGQVNLSLLCTGQLDLGFLRSFLEALQCQWIVMQVNAAFFF